ncbi:unnamed protein product [Ectocarpus sp. 12 AP-2014]
MLIIRSSVLFYIPGGPLGGWPASILAGGLLGGHWPVISPTEVRSREKEVFDCRTKLNGFIVADDDVDEPNTPSTRPPRAPPPGRCIYMFVYLFGDWYLYLPVFTPRVWLRLSSAVS